MTGLFKAFKKIIRRKSKRYYEASDVLTKKERTQLWVFTSIIIIPLVIGLSVYLIG